ncbi:hypothetical protein DACRYDRAFT_17874 [Dacryopinax primogenitus]|uniref:Uncharacterized protein n=1 Tax=Dacryopinax primogenitus (strain DJM 731) TaxID=1858805 RepID=M5FPP7_DACPD|nr:uncharacterized protein DACRYDRAFT_17874 [Dacryopinax primogenitus]EJT98690.1 hypothetical protein DACRYDRAFT_17874 [Dacryopinax primogenitus]
MPKCIFSMHAHVKALQNKLGSMFLDRKKWAKMKLEETLNKSLPAACQALFLPDMDFVFSTEHYMCLALLEHARQTLDDPDRPGMPAEVVDKRFWYWVDQCLQNTEDQLKTKSAISKQGAEKNLQGRLCGSSCRQHGPDQHGRHTEASLAAGYRDDHGAMGFDRTWRIAGGFWDAPGSLCYSGGSRGCMQGNTGWEAGVVTRGKSADMRPKPGWPCKVLQSGRSSAFARIQTLAGR